MSENVHAQYVGYIEESFADVLQKRCSLKFPQFQRKTPVLESLFINVAGMKSATLSKRLQHR